MGTPESRSPHEVILETCLRLQRDGLVVSTAGNVSVALDDEHILITPTGVAYERLQPTDLPVLRVSDGVQIEGDLVPTSEKDMHLALYRQRTILGEPVRAVMHTHAPYSTAVSTLVDVVPNVHYALATCGGPVRVAPYATYGTPELARVAARAMTGSKAALLANHGTLAAGASLEAAEDRTRILEWTCQVWLAAKGAGAPRVISEENFATVIERLRSYGQPTTHFAK